jgi:hypothetical protein
LKTNHLATLPWTKRSDGRGVKGSERVVTLQSWSDGSHHGFGNQSVTVGFSFRFRRLMKATAPSKVDTGVNVVKTIFGDFQPIFVEKNVFVKTNFMINF